MNLVIPCDSRGITVRTRSVRWNKKRHSELGWYFGWFLYNHTSGAFIEGMKAFLDAPLKVQNRPPHESVKGLKIKIV